MDRLWHRTDWEGTQAGILPWKGAPPLTSQEELTSMAWGVLASSASPRGARGVLGSQTYQSGWDTLAG